MINEDALLLFTTSSICISVIAFLVLIIFFCRFLGMAEFLFGFDERCVRQTEAVVAGFIGHHDHDMQVLVTYNTIIKYHNTFTNEDITKELIGIGPIKKDEKHLNGVNVGDHILVEYTPKKVRVIDPTFMKPNQYKISKYVTPLILSGAALLFGFILLVIAILVGG